MSTPLLEHAWVMEIEPDLILFSLPADPTDAEMTSLCKALKAWLPERQEFYALVTDTRLLSKPKMTQRKQLSGTLVSLREYADRWCAGSALVVDSTMAEGVVAAYTILTRPKYQEKAFDRVADAIEWSRSQLTAFKACKK